MTGDENASMDALCERADAIDGTALKTMRKAMGLTQEQLATEIGVAPATIGRMERSVEPVGRITGLAVIVVERYRGLGLTKAEWMDRTRSGS